MRAFKFRSEDQVAYALDIIFNRRLYCSDWSKLNDPVEGHFSYQYSGSKRTDPAGPVAELIRNKKRLRVCSLSQTFDCHLLWSHYASGFSGMAIEVELPDSPRIKPVRYEGVFAFLHLDDGTDTLAAADQVLTSKYQEWFYEREVRILQREEWFELEQPVVRVIAGHRMNPALFRALQMVCEREGIPLRRTGIGDEGIDADYVPPLA